MGSKHHLGVILAFGGKGGENEGGGGVWHKGSKIHLNLACGVLFACYQQTEHNTLFTITPQRRLTESVSVNTNGFTGLNRHTGT